MRVKVDDVMELSYR